MGSLRILLGALVFVVGCASGGELAVRSQADFRLAKTDSRAKFSGVDSSKRACADKPMICWAMQSNQQAAVDIQGEASRRERRVTVSYDKYPDNESTNERSVCADKPIACRSFRETKLGIESAVQPLELNLDQSKGRPACADKPMSCLTR